MLCRIFIRIPLLIGLIIYFDINLNIISFFKVFFMIIPIYLLALSLGFVLSIFAGIFRDIVISLPIAVNAIMMLSPIMYPIDNLSILGKVNTWNP